MLTKMVRFAFGRLGPFQPSYRDVKCRLVERHESRGTFGSLGMPLLKAETRSRIEARNAARKARKAAKRARARTAA